MELTQCTKGGYFGELALVTHKPRAASVYAVGDLVTAGRLENVNLSTFRFNFPKTTLGKWSIRIKGSIITTQ